MEHDGGSDDTTGSDALRFGRELLARTGTDTPGLDAEVLLRHVLRIDRTALFIRLIEPIPPKALTEFRRLIAERERGIPVAYLTGEREFMGLSFAVGPGVLVPRPETEILVEWAIDWLRQRTSATVIDVGTGSGAIALSIAARMDAKWPSGIVGADFSSVAIAAAAGNRARLDLSSRVALVQGSLVSWARGPIDLVLANLPYLRPDQIADNPQLTAEPRLALDGGEDGLALVRDLLRDTPRILAPAGALGLEIDPSQRDAVVSLAASVFPGSDIQVLRDLAGHDRHVIVRTAAARS